MTRANDHTDSLAEALAARQHVTPALADLDQRIGAVVRAITTIGPPYTPQQLAAVLTDDELAGLAAWTGGSELLDAECRRRAESGSKFAAHLVKPGFGGPAPR